MNDSLDHAWKYLDSVLPEGWEIQGLRRGYSRGWHVILRQPIQDIMTDRVSYLEVDGVNTEDKYNTFYETGDKLVKRFKP